MLKIGIKNDFSSFRLYNLINNLEISLLKKESEDLFGKEKPKMAFNGHTVAVIAATLLAGEIAQVNLGEISVENKYLMNQMPKCIELAKELIKQVYEDK